MEIGETNRYLKENLYEFLRGNGMDDFEEKAQDRIIRLSFLFNHIYYEESKVVFEYDNNIMSISTEEVQDSFMTHDDVSFHIMSDNVFDDAYKQFRTKYNRDKMIDDLLDENKGI